MFCLIPWSSDNFIRQFFCLIPCFGGASKKAKKAPRMGTRSGSRTLAKPRMDSWEWRTQSQMGWLQCELASQNRLTMKPSCIRIIPPCARNILVQEGLCRPEKLNADNYACHQANLFRQAYTGQLHAAPGLFSLQAGRPLQAGLCRPKALLWVLDSKQGQLSLQAGRPLQASQCRPKAPECIMKFGQQDRYHINLMQADLCRQACAVQKHQNALWNLDSKKDISLMQATCMREIVHKLCPGYKHACGQTKSCALVLLLTTDHTMVDETSNFMSTYCTVHERKSGATCVCFLHVHVHFSFSCSHWCMFHFYVVCCHLAQKARDQRRRDSSCARSQSWVLTSKKSKLAADFQEVKVGCWLQRSQSLWRLQSWYLEVPCLAVMAEQQEQEQ